MAAASLRGVTGLIKAGSWTLKPASQLKGVVVLGVWYKELPSPGGTVGSYFDAQETVTNKNGDFEVQGLGLQIFSTVAECMC